MLKAYRKDDVPVEGIHIMFIPTNTINDVYTDVAKSIFPYHT